MSKKLACDRDPVPLNDLVEVIWLDGNRFSQTSGLEVQSPCKILLDHALHLPAQVPHVQLSRHDGPHPLLPGGLLPGNREYHWDLVYNQNQVSRLVVSIESSK